jgi:hypothetical protein
VALAVSDHRFGSLLRLVREGIRLEFEFGTQSLEALAWVGQTVETSVYLPGSLARTPTGFRFALANPPLRIGAFSSVRLLVEGTPVPSDRVRVRRSGEESWRVTSALGPSAPLELRPGDPTDFEAEWPLPSTSKTVHLRLEFRNVAIPPLVWVEFRDVPTEGSPP